MFALILLFVYFVSFTDKPEKTAPQLSERAVEQRAKWGIATDHMDYPVSPMYLDSLRRMGVKIHHTSRWFNGATCEIKDEKLAAKVQALSFVTDVELTRDDSKPMAIAPKRSTPLDRMTDDQLALFNLHPLHEAGYEGQGIVMAICDNGFQSADTLPCFRQHLELGHFDFTDETIDFYGSPGDHGTKCLSTITAIADDYYGAATKARYYLMRSEENMTESPKEMDNLVAALEKADSLGVNIFSVSLGYAEFDRADWTLSYAALDGKTTRVSRAATIAARKGMLVCVAAGNSGDKEWHKIMAPADADSILTVGAVDTQGMIGAFSGFGPSADGRIKPEVCAVGVNAAIYSPFGFSMYGNGTSFAAPLIAGMAACVWSALPDENAMQIRERILRSSDRYTHPDSNQYGYGIPDAWKAYTMSTEIESEELRVKSEACRKILKDGQLWILRNGHVYNFAGQCVE